MTNLKFAANFLSIEPKPFDERTYQNEMDDDEIVDVEGRSRMKLKVRIYKIVL
jgi:hypothetical protein